MARHFAGLATAAETQYGSRLPEVVSERPPAGWARDHAQHRAEGWNSYAPQAVDSPRKPLDAYPDGREHRRKHSAGIGTKFIPFR